MMKIRIVSKKSKTDLGVYNLDKAAWVGQESRDNGVHYTLTIIIPGVAGLLRYDDTDYTFEEIEIAADYTAHRISRTVPEIVERWNGDN